MLRCTKTAYGKHEEFFLFCAIMDASMIDRKTAGKDLFFELSIGNAGNTLDGHNVSQYAENVEPSDTRRE